MSEMRVSRLIEVGKHFETGTLKTPIPGPKEVLVKVDACGIVPNTYNIVSGKASGFTLPELPCVFGLDVGGTIEAIGSQVFGLQAGDRVYVNPYLTCGTCYQCRRERKDHCENGALRGYFALGIGGAKMLSHYPVGGFSEYVLSPDTNIAVLPSNIDTKTAARFGYLGTSFGGLKKADIGPGKSLLINGVTGTLGYAAVAIALGFGCTKVLGIGRDKERLAEVESLSTLGRVSVRSSEDEGDIAEWIKKETGGIGPDAMYDCLGVGGDAEMTSKYIGSVRPGGKVVLAAGGAEGKISQDYAEAMMRDTAILGTVWFSDAEIDEMIRLIGAGVIDISFLQHKSFSLEQVNEALEFVGNRPGGAINVVVQP